RRRPASHDRRYGRHRWRRRARHLPPLRAGRARGHRTRRGRRAPVTATDIDTRGEDMPTTVSTGSGQGAKARSAGYLHAGQETTPGEQLAALQLDRLRATVKNAYDNVPLHRSRLDAAGVKPADVRSLDDVQRLPFTLKSDLRDHYPFGMFARPHGELARL